jgi:outer membrane immunogenic protein
VIEQIAHRKRPVSAQVFADRVSAVMSWGAPMFTKLLASTACLLALSGTVIAADLPTQKGPAIYVPPPPMFTWTGVYAGGQLGYQWGTAGNNGYSVPALGFLGSRSYSAHGIVGGGHGGYNYQIDQFVLGIEGDLEGSSYSGSQPASGGFASLSTREQIGGSIRGRVGYAFDRALFYATGGAAIASLNNSYSLVGTDNLYTTRVGWTAGAGVEYAIDNNWSIRAEYRYTDYGRYNDLLTNATLGTVQTRVHETDNAVRVGFSYKFDLGGPSLPIVGKY